MYKFKLDRLLLNDGTELTPGSLTIIIGPNNAGKSRFLKDIIRSVTAIGEKQRIVFGTQFRPPGSLDELLAAYPHLLRTRIDERNPQSRSIWLGPNMCSPGGLTCNHKWPQDFQRCVTDTSFFLSHFGSGVISHLTTEHRLQLIKEFKTTQDPKQRQHLLQDLYYAGKEVEERIRKIVAKAFDQTVALDYSEPGTMRFRVGQNFQNLPDDQREAFRFFAKYEGLDTQGDGFRSFVGIIVALECTTRHVIAIDEPEAFLHPPQAYRIGEFLGEKAKEGQQLFVATHSSEAVKGMLSTYPEASIVRIDRNANKNLFSVLDSKVVREFIRDPLLSSIRVIDGLFYTAAVVVEADADARFYQSVAAKYLGRDEIYFVNADNKQTVPRVLTAYRRAKVPSAGIVDFDALNSPTILRELMTTVGIEERTAEELLKTRDEIGTAAGEKNVTERINEVTVRLERATELALSTRHAITKETLPAVEIDQRIVSLRNRILEAAEASKEWRNLKRDGRSALPEKLRSRFESLYNALAEHGMFINPIGELESMLKDQGIDPTTEKRAWILRALQLLGSLKCEPDKMPWRFIADITKYIRQQTTPLPKESPNATDRGYVSAEPESASTLPSALGSP